MTDHRQAAQNCLDAASNSPTPQAKQQAMDEARIHATLAVADYLAEISTTLAGIMNYGIQQVGGGTR